MALRHYKIVDWPKWAGDLMVMKVPSNVEPNLAPDPAGGADIEILFELADLVKGTPGDFIECGVYRGQTLLSLALYLKQSRQDRILHGFDSFEGFDDKVEIDIALAGKTDPQLRKGGFGETSLELVGRRVRALGLEQTVKLHKGFFERTLPEIADKTFAFAHIDCDIYCSYLVCLEYIYPRMAKGGIILIDEYNDPNWPGCNKAIDEFLIDKVERLTMIERNNHQKYYLKKH